jgi:hypothetical protein
MTKLESLNQKYNNAVKKYRKSQKEKLHREIDDKEPSRGYIERLTDNMINGNPFELRFIKTKGIFRNSSGSCWVDMINEYGTSYNWWVMVKRIKGVLVLNTYRYSMQTSMHINKTGYMLDLLGLKYIEIAAPSGLQRLDIAAAHAADLMGKAIVAKKYARKPHNCDILRAQKYIDNLAKIGVKVSKGAIKDGIKHAEEQRASRLVRLKERRKFLEQKRLEREIQQGNVENVIPIKSA